MGDFVLNESLTWQAAIQQDPRIAATFVSRPQKILLQAGHQVYKFTEFSLYGPNGVTPWWSSVTPVLPGDTGLRGLQEGAERLGVEASEFARVRNAVSLGWSNSMSQLLRAHLTVRVYAFAGPAAGQHVDSPVGSPKVLFIGGAIQLYIPQLKAAMIAPD